MASLPRLIRLALRSAHEHRYRVLAGLFLLLVPRFRLGLGRPDADKVNALTHLVRLVCYHRVDLKLPPRINVFVLIYYVLKRGPMGRHLVELDIAKHLGASSGHLMLPLNRQSPVKPLFMAAFFSNPDDVEQILTDKETWPTRGHTGIEDLVGEGLLGLPTGPKWASHRRVVSKFLSEAHLRAFSTVIQEETMVLLSKWTATRGGVECNAQYDLSMCALDIIMRAAFGVPKAFRSQGIPQEENTLAHGLDAALKSIVIATGFPLYMWLPTPNNLRVWRALKEHKALIERVFEFGKKQFEDHPDAPPTMLSEFLRMRKEKEADAVHLTDKAILEELATIRGAGHETTSNTLSWAMLLLAQNPHELELVRKEVDAGIAGDVATFDEARALKRVNACFYEALRLYPTVPTFPRETHKDAVLTKSGYDIPAGSLVFVSQLPMNLNPALFVDPNAYKPERFLNAGELQTSKPVGGPEHPFSFVPFGAGARTCVGQRLSQIEAVIILSAVIKNCEWRLKDPSKPVEQIAEVTLGPKAGLDLVVCKR